MGAKRVRELIAWQKAMDLAEAVLKTTERWSPRAFRLTDQLERAVISVPANIAEGHGRTGPREFAHHLSIAHGSLTEVETHLLLAHRMGYIDAVTLAPLLALVEEVGRLLGGLLARLR